MRFIDMRNIYKFLFFVNTKKYYKRYFASITRPQNGRKLFTGIKFAVRFKIKLHNGIGWFKRRPSGGAACEAS